MDKRVLLTPIAMATVGLSWVMLDPHGRGFAVQAGPSIPIAVAARYFDEALEASEADGGATWGIPLYGPMLFVSESSREVVSNEADPEGRLVSRGGVYVGRLPSDVGIANTAVQWAGQSWTMVKWPLPADRWDRARLMLHECFHRIQDQLGLPARNPRNAHLDEVDGRIWLRLEWRALAAALERSGDERIEAAEDALRFRRWRRSLFAGSAREENALERNEGLAEFTGFLLADSFEPQSRRRAAAQLRSYELRTAFSRNFAYASGPAYGILLEEEVPEWREELSSQPDLGELLAELVGLDPSSLSARELVDRARAYGGKEVITQERGRAREREQRQAELRALLVEGPVLVLPMKEGRYSFDPNRVHSLGDWGSVYEGVSATGPWGRLSTSGSSLMTFDGTTIRDLRVPAPVDPSARPISGDGWTLELAEGYTLVESPASAGSFVVAQQHRPRRSVTPSSASPVRASVAVGSPLCTSLFVRESRIVESSSTNATQAKIHRSTEMSIQRSFSGAPWEEKIAYCRALRAGDHVYVTGTTALEEDGSVHAPADGEAQARRCLERIETALKELGTDRRQIVRTRMFVTDISRWEEFGRAHHTFFKDHPPTATMVEVRALIDPQMLIEIEADAYCGA